MAVYKQRASKNWWFKFIWRGGVIRESTKQANRRVAEQIEAARKTQLAKGEVGIRDRKPTLTLNRFLEEKFLPKVRTRSAAKPNTVRFYENSAANLQACTKLACLPLDQITAEHVDTFIKQRRAKVKVSTVNRDLATLRRAFRCAVEWGEVNTLLPHVQLLSGENRRERILKPDEERKYMDAATALGVRLDAAYASALEGIRAKQRGQQPNRPDAFLLRDVVTILIECGLRPEECFRLKWGESIRDNGIEIHTGKGRGSRRRIPASSRVMGVLEMRRACTDSEWVFPASTKSGHIESSTLKKQHTATLKAAGIAPFVLYTFRHTCISRWAKTMDVFNLMKLAGHTDIKTTERYVHRDDDDIREAMEKAWGGHRIGHSAESTISSEDGQIAASD